MDDLQGFAPDAQRAVVTAEAEARLLGHDRVGTEHLLLGLLADDATTAASALASAGATLAAARRKVKEAVGPASTPAAGPLPPTPRASRALGRAARFSQHRRAAAVESEHLLEGVLDVEGTAGQVLRGLGIDVDRLRASLDDPTSAAPTRTTTAPPPRAVPAPICPSCGTAIDGHLVAHRVTAAPADPDDVPRAAVVFACAACGEALGATTP